MLPVFPLPQPSVSFPLTPQSSYRIVGFGPTLPATHLPQSNQLWSHNVNTAEFFPTSRRAVGADAELSDVPCSYKGNSSSVVHVASPPPFAALNISPEPAIVPRHVHAVEPVVFLSLLGKPLACLGAQEDESARRLRFGLLRARVTLHPPGA